MTSRYHLVSTSAVMMLLLLCMAPGGGSGAPCPEGMAEVHGRFCIDRYEASLDLIDDNSAVVGVHSPYEQVKDSVVRAASRRGVVPQGHISRDEAEKACGRAGKRLCTSAEWLSACQGEPATLYPYGTRRRSGYCNDQGRSPLAVLWGANHGPMNFHTMNDRRLNQAPGTLARTGQFPLCTNGLGVFDMVGNLHEWVSAPEGLFRGGYYQDTIRLGEGCEYRTAGHGTSYRDYSTGFRCCADRHGG